MKNSQLYYIPLAFSHMKMKQPYKLPSVPVADQPF